MSVVICAYTEKRWSDTANAISSVLSQSKQALEILLVVDHNDQLFQRSRRAFEPLVNVIQNFEGKGLSGARNSGFKRCRGDVVAFLDDDAVADRYWLEQLSLGFSDPDVLGVGGRVMPSWQRSRPSWFPPEFDWVVGCSHSGMPMIQENVRNFVGANMAFRRAVLLSTGGFSSRLGRNDTNTAGCEETELCIRVVSVTQNSRLVYEPKATVFHSVPYTRGTWSYFIRRCFGEGLSKARVAKLATRTEALSSERNYLRSTVPRAILRSFTEILLLRPSASLRVLAIVTGTLVTMGGYFRGTIPPSGSDAILNAHSNAREMIDGKTAANTFALSDALWVVIPLALTIGLWVSGLTTSKLPSQMTDYGLLSILPKSYFIGLAVITVSFVRWIRRPATQSWILLSFVIVLLAMLHLTPAILYGTLRYTWAWKHVAITNYVIAHHGVNITQSIPSLVAYQDWPGFFTLNALLTSGSGFSSALSYASFGPFANELLYAAPLFLIFRSFTNDRRVHWTALWLFYIGNWIGQDYFSPQGYAFFLYLLIIGMTLKHFMKPNSPLGLTAPSDVRASAQQQEISSPQGLELRWLYALVILMMIAIASSHQLTPFMLVSALVFLTVFKALRTRSLVPVSLFITIGWIALAARTFVTDNTAEIFHGFGAFLSNATVNQVNLANASHDQLVISKIDYLLTGSIILLGVFGFLRSWKASGWRHWVPAAALTISPVVALAGNNYGGEIVFRVYLFGLPFLALFGAEALRASKHLNASIADAALCTLFGLFLIGFLFSYYGKERTNYFSAAEVTGIQRVYRIAPFGSYLTGVVGNNPWPLENYNRYLTYWYSQNFTVKQLVANPVQTLIRNMSSYRHSYVIFTASDAAEIQMTGILPPGEYQKIMSAVAHSNRFRIVENDPSVFALQLVPKTSANSVQAISLVTPPAPSGTSNATRRGAYKP